MFYDCSKHSNFYNFQCKTKDMIVFNCDCDLFVSRNRWQRYPSSGDYRYFSKWFNQTDLNLTTSYEWDDMETAAPKNIISLFTYCKNKHNDSFMNCYLRHNSEFNQTICNCVSPSLGSFFIPEFYFDNSDVWSDENEIISSTSASPTTPPLEL